MPRSVDPGPNVLTSNTIEHQYRSCQGLRTMIFVIGNDLNDRCLLDVSV